MSAIDEALEANENYARNFSLWYLNKRPVRRLAVVACMDARLQVEQALGLGPGEAHILRNAGGIVTEDVLRSLILSHHLLETREIMIINRTHCGALGLDEDDLRTQLSVKTGVAAGTPSCFHGFRDLEENVRRQIAAVRSHPWIPAAVAARGFVYDVETGRLTEVAADSAATAA